MAQGLFMKFVGACDAWMARWEQEALSIFRIVIAFLFIQHGTQSLFGFPIEPRGGDYDPIFSLGWIAGSMELWLGIPFLVGLFTRPLAFLFCGLTAVAYFMVHAPRGFWTIANGGEPAVLFCFSFLLIAAAGGGRWSVDRYLGQSPGTPNS
jgi:putative oxidoreductase